ncbi:tyrosine-type recombinase/integrase [Nocardia asiatica]|uniref:tyrosine-type recombinase/integrase n=1 Tax=Nocardia asiatica TaxID=209252 RepID=UPI003EE1F060
MRWCDVDLGAQPPRITFSGTIVRIKGKGLIRQEWTKTDSGYRTVVLPQFVVDTLRRVKAEAIENELDLVFPNRDGGIWDPHNFNRLWRQARGDKFAWVTPKTFRKTVASLIADQYGPQAAAQQLGHANDSVTKRHYMINRPNHPTSPQPWDASRDENVSFPCRSTHETDETRVELIRSPWSQLPHLDSNQKPAD